MIRVAAGTRIPVPVHAAVRSVRVISVAGDAVQITGRSVGTRRDSTCAGQCETRSDGRRFRVTVGSGSTAIENRLQITVVDVDGETARLRLTTR